MDTISKRILNALDLFYQSIKYIFLKPEDIVDNCESVSDLLPLSAKQGMELQKQINEIKVTIPIIYSGEEDPDPSLGENGDLYLKIIN